jgi:hypothetical protein
MTVALPCGMFLPAVGTHQIFLTLIDMILPLLSFLPCARVLHSTQQGCVQTTTGQQQGSCAVLQAMQHRKRQA